MPGPEPGDVVPVDFPGATGLKRRPAVVVSSRLYHEHRPDLVLGVLTTQTTSASAPTDYLLQDWQEAGLHRQSAFRAYFGMAERSAVRIVGRLSERDWQGVRSCLAKAFDIGGGSRVAG